MISFVEVLRKIRPTGELFWRLYRPITQPSLSKHSISYLDKATSNAAVNSATCGRDNIDLPMCESGDDDVLKTLP